MNIMKQVQRSLLLALWFAVLTFPIMVIRVNTITDTIEWRWERLLTIAIGSFFGSLVWNYFQRRKAARPQRAATVAANLLPARRAALVQPAEVLRGE